MPAADDTPTAAAASSLLSPRAISSQNRRSTSRRCDGAPGDFIGDRPVNAFIHPAGLPTDTSTIRVLRRPVESTQFTSVRFSERLAEAAITSSVGSVGDSYHNALAETINGLYKTELIKHKGPWRSVEQVEYATAEYIDWFNHRRLYEYCGDIPPAELEEAYYHQIQSRQPVGNHKT